MKKLIFVITTIALIVGALTFGAYATEDVTVTDVAEPTESVTEAATAPVEVTEAEILTEAPSAADTAPADVTEALDEDGGEKTIPLDEFLLRLWDEYRDSILSAASTIISLVVAIALKNRYIPSINRDISRIFSGQSEQEGRLNNFTDEVKGTLDDVTKKLETFENYDALSKEMKQVFAEARLDRQVLIKTIELQADQIEHLIEFSHLSQARKDQLYEGYRAQLQEINKLKGDGTGEA